MELPGIRAGRQPRRPTPVPVGRIVCGAFDDYVSAMAPGIRGLDYPVAIRFAHEMNGFWYPWCEQSNGDRPGDYVNGWRHVHDIFSQDAVHNVIWVWSPKRQAIRRPGTGDPPRPAGRRRAAIAAVAPLGPEPTTAAS